MKTRGAESYICEHCGVAVAGRTNNNHCPTCLWSKHLDLDVPGDRLSTCRGMMEPVGIDLHGGVWRIVQRCRECGKEFIVDCADDDNQDVIMQLSQMMFRG